MVSEVLSQRKATVRVQSGQYLNSVEEVGIQLSTLIKTLCIRCRPPVMQVTISVILPALVVKSMSHFVANHHTYCSIVEGCIGFRVEERALKDACREANLVGCRVIIGIHCLWSHVPFVPVNRLSSLVSYHLLQGKVACIQHVLIETL